MLNVRFVISFALFSTRIAADQSALVFRITFPKKD